MEKVTKARSGEKVIAAARKLFAQYGHSKTSVEEIAKEAGLSKATVYNHFSGKEHIVAGVIECERRILIEKLRLAVEDAHGPLDAFRSFFRTRVREIQRLHNSYRAETGDYLRYMPHVARAIESNRREERLLLERIIGEGVSRGAFRPVKEPALTADLLFSTAVSLTFPLFGRPVRSSGKRLDVLMDMFLAGICSDDYRQRILGEESR